MEWLHWTEVADKEDGISFCFPQFVHQLPDRLPFIEMSRACMVDFVILRKILYLQIRSFRRIVILLWTIMESSDLPLLEVKGISPIFLNPKET